ncbi:hypothetical protein [Dickeya dadantii]|uniref:Glutathionylspermidine synthase pre-ATP-grasp-like domain-containing protein n=1 Tax=Dickeya dadantii (strain 3937) TaxID=198628 RepID=E0SFE2_DICD3|nr:hypothetical protein [Dickeya dadantii]ADM99994.1 hypothetical protein Dda3937_04299 [Dickeya dadantii 3937]NPE54347.1 hypothetical protein [Dickeya dadantii]NPE66373.1 hypothetical protein [Dickeya dadantii]
MRDITSEAWKYFSLKFSNEIINADITDFKVKTIIKGRRYYYPPTILNQSLRDEIERISLRLMNIVSSIPEKYFGGDIDAWIKYLGYDDYEAHFLRKMVCEKFLRRALLFTRPDFILTENGPRLCEVNVAATIGGMNGNENYINAFQETVFFKHMLRSDIKFYFDFPERHWEKALHSTRVNSTDLSMPVMFEALASALDSSPMRKTFVDMAIKAGFKVISGIVQELDIREDGVYVSEIRINVLYTRFTWDELKKYAPFELILALSEADNNGLIDFISPPVYTLFDNKKNLVLLSAALQKTDDELSTIIPETFNLDAENHLRVTENKNDWVIKPACDYGGKGVFIGSEFSEQNWLLKIQTILKEKVSYIAQRKITEISEFTDPFGESCAISAGGLVFNGVFSGVYLRRLNVNSQKLVINGAQGAECAPAVFFKKVN